MPDQDTTASLTRMRLLGVFALTSPAGRQVAIRSRRGRGLLAFLHLTRDHSASRERLAGLLWSDRGEEQARASLRQCLWEMRDELAAADIAMLEIGRERVTLDSTVFTSDVADLLSAVSGDRAEALVAALAAAGQRRLLEDLDIPGLFQDWLTAERGRLDQTVARGVQAALSRWEALGDWPKVRQIAETYLQRDPLDEGAAASAIRGDVATGNTSSAHRRFQILQTALAKEFGVAPSEATRQALATPARDATAGRPAAPSASAAQGFPGVQVGPPLVLVPTFDAHDPHGAHASFTANLRDEVVSGLSRFGDLRVITDPRRMDRLSLESGTDLAGAYALAASLRSSAEGARLIARLVRLGDNRVIWSERFAMADMDIVETVDNIIAQTIGAVLPKINADVLQRPSHLPIDPTYRRYLLARERAISARTFPEAQAAARELEAMIEAFPDYAQPYLPLAYLYNTDFGHTLAGSSGETERVRALDLAKRALMLDRGDANGYTASGWSYLRRRQWASARGLFEQALDLNPFHATRVMEVGYGMVFLGDLKQAAGLLDRCLLLNPAPHDGFFQDLGLLSLVQGEYDRAASYFELIADPGVWGRLYEAMNAELGAFATREKTEGAWRAITAIWPRDRSMDVASVSEWIASHHPFQVPEVEERFLRAARRALARQWR